MLLAALGYVLIERLRALALRGTVLACAQVDTLHIKLLKLAAVVTHNTRRIRLYLAANWPSADICTPCVRCAPLALHQVPGPRIDTKTARDPSRGRGSCARTSLIASRRSCNGLTTPRFNSRIIKFTPISPYSGICVKYAG